MITPTISGKYYKYFYLVPESISEVIVSFLKGVYITENKASHHNIAFSVRRT